MAARTVLGPLTTTFVYPSSCGVVVKACDTCDNGYQGQTCGTNVFNTQGVQDGPSCWPPRSNPSLTTEVAFNGWGIYSPGINCPEGYTTACAATSGVDGGFPFQFSLEKSETAAGCCPTGYHCLYEPGINQAQTCIRVYSTGSFPTVQCSSEKSNSFSYLSMPATITATVTADATASNTADSETVVVLSRITVLAPLFQLNWQSSDRSAETTAKNSGSDTSNPTKPTHSGAQQSNPSNGSDDGGGHLSKGAAAGIGIGVGIVGLLLLGALVWFVRRRRSVRASELSAQPVQPQEWKQPGTYAAGYPTPGGYSSTGGYPTPAGYSSPGSYPTELSTTPVAELPGAQPRY